MGDSQFQVPINATFTAVSQNRDITSPNSGTSVVQLTGTWSGTLIVEGSNDETTFLTIPVMNSVSYVFSDTMTANGIFIVNTNGYENIRVRSSTWTSGTANLNVYGSDTPSLVYTDTKLRGLNGTAIGNDGDRLNVQNLPSKISILNSTSTPLSGAGVFTGTWEDCLKYSTITVSIFTSHNSALNGLQFQTSTDGVNWDDGDSFTLSAMSPGGAKVFSFGVTSQYFRIVYTNGATLQTGFRLQTILHYNAIKNSSHRIVDSVVDDDDAELVKSIITGKSELSGDYKNVATDDDGRLLISGQSELLSPLPSIKVVERRVLAPGGVYALTTNITQDTAIKEFTFGGRGPGEGMFGRYVASDTLTVPGGGFNSSGDVALWSSTGTEVLLGGTPAYSTLQAFEGTGSVQLQFDDSDSNHIVEISYTWSTPQSMDVWRYVNAKFYNSPPGGGAVTRTISIVLTDNATNKRFYSVSGLTNVAPFNAAGWIDVLGEIRIPSSQTGSTFDINNVTQISLRLVDSGNKAGTVYWDIVKLVGSLDVVQKIYTNGNTIPLNFDPIVPFDTGEVMYLALRNNDTVAREFQITVAGVDIS